jgi:hypothetical protein
MGSAAYSSFTSHDVCKYVYAWQECLYVYMRGKSVAVAADDARY